MPLLSCGIGIGFHSEGDTGRVFQSEDDGGWPLFGTLTVCHTKLGIPSVGRVRGCCLILLKFS